MAELKGYFGEDLEKYRVNFDGREWFFKERNEPQKKRDFLGYLLAKNWANVTPTQSVNFKDLEATNKQEFKNCNDANCWLVRIGDDLNYQDIPIKNLDQAVARELVFSLWTRRMDTHAYNRVFHNGLPVFFDFDTCFGGEMDLKDIDNFFDNNRNGPGRGIVWKVRQKVGKHPLDTEELRTLEKSKGLSLHYVNDFHNFEFYVEEAKSIILNNNWPQRDLIAEAGYQSHEIEEVHQFLSQTKATLENDIERMKKVIYRND